MLEATWAYASTGAGWEAYETARERALGAEVPDEIFEPADSLDPDWEWTRLNMDYDPLPALEQLDVPLLALFGGRDRNVVVADNVPAMRAALDRGGNPDFELFIVPGADHGLREVTEGQPLPMHRRFGFGSAGWPKLAAWLAERFDLVEPPPP